MNTSVLAANCQLPRFVHDTVTLPWAQRCPLLADLIVRSGATVVSLQEIGTVELGNLLKALGSSWQGHKAVGLNGNGLNAVIWRDEWRLSEVVLDYNLPSYGQMQRTLLLVNLVHQSGVELLAGSTHFAATGPDLARAQANIAKLAQVKRVCELTTSHKQVVLGADLARTDDGDDVEYLIEQGWLLNGRTAATPQVVLSKGTKVGESSTVDTGKACDHSAVLTSITIP